MSTMNVHLFDLILTPVACALLVNEVMKNLLYHRSQIPYPYAWLKNIINKKRNSLEEKKPDSLKNVSLNKHYQVVSSAYDSAESIMTHILNVCSNYGTRLKEVVFVIGVTPVCPKEVFSIRVLSLASDHLERNHAVENSKKQPKVLRGIFLDNSWMNLTENPLNCSNTYVFIKLSGNSNIKVSEDSIFVPSKPLVLSPNVKHTTINLNYIPTEKLMCCDNLKVFKDSNNLDSPKKSFRGILTQQNSQESDNNELWLQSKIVIKGFKDCFINKVSACELW